MDALDPTLSVPPEPVSRRIYNARRVSLGLWLRAAEAVDNARRIYSEAVRTRRKVRETHPLLERQLRG